MSANSPARRSLPQILVGVAAAAVLTLFCLNIFNPLPGLFTLFAEILRPIGELLPYGWEFIPLLLFLVGMNVFLAVLIYQQTLRRWPTFSLTFYRASILFVIAGAGYILMVMYALSRLQ